MRRNVLVTGGAGGIGSAICVAFAQTGCNVAVHYRKSREKAERLAGILRESYGADAVPVQADVADSGSVRSMFDEIERQLGALDILVNNAGIAQQKLFVDITDDDWRSMTGTDLDGVFYCSREAVKRFMLPRHSGVILNVASQGGLMGYAGSSAYCAAKFAVVGLSEVLRQELAPFHIEVSAVCPGSFRTDFRKPGSMREPSLKVDAYDGTAVRRAGDFLHANRNNQAGDPKKAAVFLCDMVEKGYLPSRILIGAKCCADVRDMLKEQLENIASYEAASAQTDF